MAQRDPGTRSIDFHAPSTSIKDRTQIWNEIGTESNRKTSTNKRKLEKTIERSNRILRNRRVIEYYAESMQTIRNPRQPQNKQRTITTFGKNHNQTHRETKTSKFRKPTDDIRIDKENQNSSA